jgi:hypothetical protein
MMIARRRARATRTFRIVDRLAIAKATDVSRSTDARRIIDCSDKDECDQVTDAWDGHEPAAGRRGPCHAAHICVDCSDRRHDGSPRGDQTPHGGRETRGPFAGFESLVDECGGERTREPDPEHNCQAG